MSDWTYEIMEQYSAMAADALARKKEKEIFAELDLPDRQYSVLVLAMSWADCPLRNKYYADIIVDKTGKVMKNRPGIDIPTGFVVMLQMIQEGLVKEGKKYTTLHMTKAMITGKATLSTEKYDYQIALDPTLWEHSSGIHPRFEPHYVPRARFSQELEPVYFPTQVDKYLSMIEKNGWITYPAERAEGNIPPFIGAKKDGQPLEFCVAANPTEGKAEVLATEWTGPDKGKFIPDPSSQWGYQTVEVRGNIEVEHRRSAQINRNPETDHCWSCGYDHDEDECCRD